MKTLKVKSILFSLLAVMAVAVFMTSCEQSTVGVADDIQDISDNALYQVGDPIDEIVTYEDFEEVAALIESQGYEPTNELEGDFSLSDMDITSRGNSMCETCQPWLSDIRVYNFSGNTKGFAVDGGRHYPCSYDLEWKVFYTSPPYNATINWQSSGFASITFNSPGTYYVVVRLTSTDGNGSPCYVYKFVSVVI